MSHKTYPRSGRTTTMLTAALMAHDKGKAVYVIGIDHAHADWMRDEMRVIMERFGRNPMERGISSIKFECESSLADSFDWRTGILHGAAKNVEVFVDHFALESHFSWAFREAHRFDHPKAN